jgi:hypothetical protein
LKDFPLYSQEKNADPLVGVKLFHAFGAGTLYLTECDPEGKRAFGYVTGLGGDEWGYVSIDELAAIWLGPGIPSIEVDLYLSPKPFSQIPGCQSASG